MKNVLHRVSRLLIAFSTLLGATLAHGQDYSFDFTETAGQYDWEAAIPADHPKNPVKLRFVVWDGDQALRALRPAVQAFEDRFPWIEVQLESVTSNFMEKLLAQYAANVAPDVAMMDPSAFQRFARRDAILPLNEFFDDIPGFDIGSYYKPLVDAHSYRGTVYVLPRDIAPISLIYYNKRLFDQAGIPYPDGTWTWNENGPRPEMREKCFLWVVEQLTGKNERGQPVWGYAPGWGTLPAEMMALSMGARMADSYEDPREVLFDDPRFIKAYQFSADMGLVHKWVPTQTEMTNQLQSSAWQLFVEQRIVMFQSGIWEVPNIRKALVPGQPQWFEWDIALAPHYEDPLTGEKSLVCPSGGSGYAIMKSTKYPLESWLLTAWMAGPPGMQAMAESGIAQPGIREMALREPWIPGPNTPADQLYPPSRIVTDISVPHCHWGPTNEKWPEVASYVWREYEKIYMGTATAQEVVPKGVREAENRLAVLLAEEDLPPFNWGAALILGLLAVAGLGAWVYAPSRGMRLTRRQKKENLAGYGFTGLWIFGLLAFTVGPMILSLFMSFADWDIITTAQFRGWANYHEAFFVDPRFVKSLQVTAVYAVFAVPLGLIGSLLLALLLNVKVWGTRLWRTLFYLPALASGVAASLLWRRLFQPEGGLINEILYGPVGTFFRIPDLLNPIEGPGGRVNWLGSEQTALPGLVIMSLWGIGGGMVILLAGLQGIPQHYYEAATVDGAGKWMSFKNVTLPLLSPSLFFSLVTGIIGTFQVFTQAFVMTAGGPNDATRFAMLHLYENAFVGLRMGYASSMAWVLFLIILVLTIVQFRFSKWVYYEDGSR